MTVAAERIMQQRNTLNFIKASPFRVVFRRLTETADGAGGRNQVWTNLAAQQVRIVPARTRSSSLTYTKPTGEVISSKDLLLVGMPSLNVQQKDRFTWQGQAFQISYVETVRDYETLCQVDQLGENDDSTV